MGNHTISPARPDDKLRELEAIHRQLDALTRQLAANHDVLVEIRNVMDDFCRVFLSSRFRYGRPADRFARPPSYRGSRS
jgi:hypothetical protein